MEHGKEFMGLTWLSHFPDPGENLWAILDKSESVILWLHIPGIMNDKSQLRINVSFS